MDKCCGNCAHALPDRAIPSLLDCRYPFTTIPCIPTPTTYVEKEEGENCPLFKEKQDGKGND